jgi:hypothetical protein
MRHAVFVLLIVAGAAGCATMRAAATRSTEEMLSTAGFRRVPADTPETLADLHGLRPRQIVPAVRDGQTTYVYADPEVCKCLYVGTEAQYQDYQRRRRQKHIADEEALDPWRSRLLFPTRR